MIRHAWKALIVVTLLGICSIGGVAAQGTTYTDPQGRYSFTVPSGWQAGSAPQGTNLPQGTAIGGIFGAPAPLNGNFNVVTVAVPAGVNLDQLVTQSRAGVAQSVPGYQEVAGGIQNTTVGGQSARRYDYSLTPPGSGKLHGAQVIALQGNTVYVLTFTAAENDFNTFFQQGSGILNSFKFLGTGGAMTLPTTGMARGMQWHGEGKLLILLAGSALIVAGLTLHRRYRPA